MPAGEVLIKISDYPFSFSILGSTLAILNFTLNENNYFIFATIGGFLGTFIITTDPLGRLLKWIVKFSKPTKKYDNLPNKEFSEVINVGRKTKPIALEIDKIVHMLYFVIALTLFYITFTFIDDFASHFILNKEICNLHCLRIYSLSIGFIALPSLGVIAGLRLTELRNRVFLAGIFQGSINSKFVSNYTLNSMSQSIENANWESAENWMHKMEEEVNNESILFESRNDNLDAHISSIFLNFKEHKQKCEDDNKVELQRYIDGDHSGKTLSLIEILQTFSFYERLMEHLYTNEDKEKFKQIQNVFQFNKDWEDSFQSTFVYKTTSTEKIISKLKVKKQKETKYEIWGENGQWINLELLSSHLDHYVSYTRTELIPITQKENSALYQVRFFDRRGHEYLGPDVIAELYQEDANNLSNALDTLARELRQKNSGVQQIYQKVKSAEDQLKKSLNELVTAYDVKANPIKGSCKYCQNENFWNKEKISSDKKELEKMPQIVFLKQ